MSPWIQDMRETRARKAQCASLQWALFARLQQVGYDIFRRFPHGYA